LEPDVLVKRKSVNHLAGMKRNTRCPTTFSKGSAKRRAPDSACGARAPRPQKSGDTARYRLTEDGVLLANEMGNPFATFSEWSRKADEKAYGDL
jgi:hypothetical protein